jgi:transposase-like protein
MKKSTRTVIDFPQVSCKDVLTEILRDGARKLIHQAVEEELESYMESINAQSSYPIVIRNGYLPQRNIQTSLGEIEVRQPRVRVKKEYQSQTEKFTSDILPPYLRRTKTMEELIPWLYLKGVSTGDFSDALSSLLGKEARGLSANTITRLKNTWLKEYEIWSRRNLSNKNYVYIWVDGIYFNVRLEDSRSCILVIIGATVDGKKELLSITAGFRESKESWKSALLSLKDRGLEIDPKLAIGDGALGF